MGSTQWRAWIGPRWRNAGESGADKWLEVVATAIDLAEQATTLSATLASGATTASLTAVSGYPAANGWAFIGPNGTGQSWEYVDYSAVSGNTLTGLTRESTATREHNGAHNSGAVVRLFWPITTDDGTLTLVERLDDTQGVINWTATISGVLWPAAALRHAHLVAIEYRQSETSDWEWFCLGWVDAPRVRDNERKTADWTINILSSLDMIAQTVVDGVRCGEFNIAHFGRASGDTVLAQAMQERGSGDFLAAAPDLSHGSAVDEDDETLWIGERFLASAAGIARQTTLGGAFDEFASIVRIWKYPGEPDGYRFIEFVGVSNNLNRQLCNSNASVDVLVELSSVPDGEGRLAIVEDAYKFASVHPLASNRIVEVGSAVFDAFNLTKDCVALMTPGSNTWSNVVAWGSGADDLRAKHENSPDPDEYSEEWPGANIPTPGAGEMIRWWYNASATKRADHFQTDEIDIALYTLGAGEDPWLLLEIPGMGLMLRDDIAADDPGTDEMLYVVDAGGNPATGGLPNNGTVQIGTEQITYSAKTADGLLVDTRGDYSTSAVAHVAGDAVLFRDSDGTATSGVPIKSVGFRRPNGALTLKSFRLRRSNLESVRVATDDNHDDDYETLATVTGSTATTYDLALSPSRRCRFIILEIDHMGSDPARPRINELVAYLDEDYYPAESWLMAPTAGDVIEQVLINAGLPAGAIAVVAGTQDVEKVSTARDAAGVVVADVAEFAGCLVEIGRVSSVAISNSTFWSAASHSPIATWTRSDVSQVEVVQAVNRAISQIKLPWRTPDNSDSGEEQYPATLESSGKPLTLDEMIYAGASSAQNAAKRHFLAARYPWRFVLELAETQPAVRPGDIYAIQWQFASDVAPMLRTLRLSEAEHTIRNGVWSTTVVGLQIDREATT